MPLKKGGMSLQEFREWATTQGQVGNPGAGNNSYKGQCVTLVQAYLYGVFGLEYSARGNAKDFVPPSFTKLPANTTLKPGDIIRYGANYGAGYGHIGLIDDTGYFLDQNGTTPLHVSRRATPFTGIDAVFRPSKPFNIKKGGNNMIRLTQAEYKDLVEWKKKATKKGYGIYKTAVVEDAIKWKQTGVKTLKPQIEKLQKELAEKNPDLTKAKELSKQLSDILNKE